MLTRPIPATNEPLPVIGCGTWRTFNVRADSGHRPPLQAVLQTLFNGRGTVVDSSPIYNRAEGVVGGLLAERPAHPRPFLATKVRTEGRDAGLAQMTRSLDRLGGRQIDLMQIYNLEDWRTHLATLREWKAEGRVRLVGITHFKNQAHPALEAVMRAEPIDSLRVNLALGNRTAEGSLLPLAAPVDRPQTLPNPGPAAWAALAGLALFSTVLAHALCFRLVQHAGPANALLVTGLIPVTALLPGNLALHEPITPSAVLGAAVILAGLALLGGRWLPRTGVAR